MLSIWLSGRAYDPPEPSEHLHSGPFVRCKIRVLSFLLKTGNELRRLKPQQHVNMINRLSWQKKKRVIYLFIFSCLICSLPWFSVVREIQSLITVLQHVFRNPFILVMPALRCHCCNGSVQAPKINLKPLIFIGCFS